MNQLLLIENDPYLEPYKEIIKSRIERAKDKERQIIGDSSLLEFANGHQYFGLHKTVDSWIFREWAPNATNIFMVGDFSGWEIDPRFALHNIGNGIWEIKMPLDALKHGDYYKLNIAWGTGQGFRIPAWCRRVVQDEKTKIFSAQVWDPPKKYRWKHKKPALTEPPLVYEAHVGMSGEGFKINTFEDFRKDILPRIAKNGYNTIQLMAIQEHPYYGSFGYHVSNFFAPSSRFGTPEELKRLVDEAHRMGLRVVMDIVHSHAVKNVDEGLALFDGTSYQYFHQGDRGYHVAWDSKCFDYGKNEVLHFLLSNCKYWLEEFQFDGFRYDGITSMLYHDHGLSRDFTSYEQYYDGGQDEDAITYLMLSNNLVHRIDPNAITIAEEMSGMPGLAMKQVDGGFGFDFRLAMGVPDYWIKLIKERKDEEWDVGEMYYELTNRRSDEKTIIYAESHDQALVGDKTIIFRLIDKEMYFSMGKDKENIIVDRGIALHKIIRLLTLSLGGDGYLNFMGNEFGHPEWIDFPSERNNWSYQYARRQWSLAENKKLRYHYLLDFDHDMIRLTKKFQLMATKNIRILNCNPGDQVLAFERKGLILVFNFNPVKSFTDYGIDIGKGTYKMVLNTDSPIYGGHDRIDESMEYKTIDLTSKNDKKTQLWLYLPSQTALIFKRK